MPDIPIYSKEEDGAVLGRKVEGSITHLDRFKAPAEVEEVTLTSDEVTALCPVTGQPDFYTVRINYVPDKYCIESKSLKLYLQSFREKGAFAEELAGIIRNRVVLDLDPVYVEVEITQKSRGGITLSAIARFKWQKGEDSSADSKEIHV